MAAPTRDAVIKQVRDDLASEGVSQVWLRRAFEAALATVVGGLLWAWYSWVDAIAKQASPLTATGAYLDAWARIYNLTRTAAGTATGTIVLTGNAGATQPAGSIIIGPDGQELSLDADTTLDGDPGDDGAAYPTVTAVAAGVVYNLTVGTPLTVASPASGIDAASSVGTTGITGGQTAETDDELRSRLLDRIRFPGATGHERDYVRWAREAHTSVSRAWAYPSGITGTEPGAVLVLFAVAGSNPIPSGGTVTTVANYIAARRPAGSTVTVEAPAANAVTLTIALDPAQDTTANRTLLEGYLTAYFNTLSPGTTARNLDIRAAMARGGVVFDLRVIEGGSGSADVVPATAKTLLYKGTVTWETW